MTPSRVGRAWCNAVALALGLAGSACGCATAGESAPAMPRVVRVPSGWLGRLRAEGRPVQPVVAEPAGAEPTDDVEALTLTPVTNLEEPAGAPAVVPLASTDPRSGPIRNGFFNPIPGATFAGYVGDTGLDLASPPRAVYAIAAGTLDYAEEGHTRWRGPKDTPFSVRLTLDAPIAWKSRHITHVYYTHLSAVAVEQPEGALPRHHVEGGERLGTSGVANGLPHLHLGLLLDGNVEQDSWDGLLVESDVRAALGGYKNGDVLPK